MGSGRLTVPSVESSAGGIFYSAIEIFAPAGTVSVNTEAEVELHDLVDNYREFIVLKALVFPWINILWAGCVIMVIGTVMAIRRRVRLG